MSKESYERVRNKTIAFRVTEQENDLINKYVALSGLTKQEYLTSNMLNQTIVVKPNVRVVKNLQKVMVEILQELKRLDDSSQVDEQFRNLIRYVENLCERIANK